MKNGITIKNRGDFPAFWDSTITLYNKILIDNKPEWVRHVFHNVFFKSLNEKQMNGNTVFHSTSYIVRIPKNNLYVSTSNYSDYENTFTVQTGDMVFFGEVNEIIDETNPDKRSNAVMNRYKGRCFLIKAFSENIHNIGLKHYRIEG